MSSDRLYRQLGGNRQQQAATGCNRLQQAEAGCAPEYSRLLHSEEESPLQPNRATWDHVTKPRGAAQKEMGCNRLHQAATGCAPQTNRVTWDHAHAAPQRKRCVSFSAKVSSDGQWRNFASNFASSSADTRNRTRANARERDAHHTIPNSRPGTAVKVRAERFTSSSADTRNRTRANARERGRGHPPRGTPP